MRLPALVVASLLPFAALAQSGPPVPSTPPAPATPPAPPPAVPEPAAPPVAPAPKPQPAPPPASAVSAEQPPLIVDFSGWFVLDSWRNFGSFANGATDLPTAAGPNDQSLGVAVRQSRLRANVTVPSDGLLGGARLRGLVEMDFLGTYVRDDPSLPQVRLRHAWASATWKDLGNLTVLLGQTWDVFEGPQVSASLGHLAVPRFGGAGFLYRRAPQLRVSAETRGPLAVGAQVAAVAPNDRLLSAGISASERSSMPDLEGRVAVMYRPGPKRGAELGVSGRYGQEEFLLDGQTPPANTTVESPGVALDGRIDLPYVQLLGAGFVGKGLSTYGSVAPGIRLDQAASKLYGARAVHSRGFWVQGVVTPVPVLQLAVGGGMEDPTDRDLTGAKTVARNAQLSGAAIVSLTSRWRASVEATYYDTRTLDRTRYESTQLEVASLFAF